MKNITYKNYDEDYIVSVEGKKRLDEICEELDLSYDSLKFMVEKFSGRIFKRDAIGFSALSLCSTDEEFILFDSEDDIGKFINKLHSIENASFVVFKLNKWLEENRKEIRITKEEVLDLYESDKLNTVWSGIKYGLNKKDTQNKNSYTFEKFLIEHIKEEIMFK